MESIWTKTCEIEKRGRLEKDIETEVAVIGAGMAGILAAYELWQTGRQVVVLEAGRIAGGQTKNTTAKITSQHGMIYHSLIAGMGEEKARQYAMANEAAIEEYRRIIAREGISCDFEETCNYVYSQDWEKLESETEAAVRLGLPASLVRELSIPAAAAGAVRFERQAQFHPLKFLKAVSEKLTIYEDTAVETVEQGELKTSGGVVKAGQIIFTCHYPFINFPGMYFARMHQERSYVLALENAGKAGGMYIGEGDNSYSFRDYGDLLLLGGGQHRTGKNHHGGRYDMLRQKAREWYPQSREVAHWSAQDCITLDRAPYIGRYASGKPDWYVATGFQKWGMSTSMAAAMILRDMISGTPNPYAAVFDPGRFSTEGIPQLARESGEAVKGLTKRIFQIPEETAGELAAGRGGIVSLDGEKVGVYKDEDGRVFAVTVRCPHLGCQLEWNPDEKSWDCPCHGSRFDYRGARISGPAQEGIGNE